MVRLGIRFWHVTFGSFFPAPPNINSVTLSPLPATEDVQITATVAWVGYPRIGVSYQWQIDGANITGANEATYTPVTADVDGDLTCEVTIDNGEGTDSAESAASTVVAAPVWSGNALLLEGGDRLLLENGDEILTEAA